MFNVLVRNKVKRFDFYTTKEEILNVSLSEEEIKEVLEKAGVKEFNGLNFDEANYQTMPGWVHVNLQYETLTETLMKGLLKK